MQNDRPSLPEQPEEERPDLISITCIIGWVIVFADILFSFLPTIHHYLIKNFPTYVIYSVGAIDILYAVSFWLIWKMRILGVWLYTFVFLCMLCIEYFFSINFFSSIALGGIFLIVFISYYREMQ